MILLAMVLAIGAGAGFAVASALQHRATQQEETTRLGDPRLLVRLTRRPAWLLANGLDLIAVALQTGALRSGAIVLVQPLMVSGLILAVPAEAALNRRPVSRRDLAGVVVGGLALAVFVVVADPGGGIDAPRLSAWLVVLIAGGVIAGAAVAVGRTLRGAGRAIGLGIATGVLYGITAALLKDCSTQVAHPLTLLSDWRLYALLVVGLVGFALNQNVFQAGSLAAGLTAMTLTEPIVALVIGTTAFHEHLDAGGPRGAGLAAAALGIAASIILVAGDASSRNPADTPAEARPAADVQGRHIESPPA